MLPQDLPSYVRHAGQLACHEPMCFSQPEKSPLNTRLMVAYLFLQLNVPVQPSLPFLPLRTHGVNVKLEIVLRIVNLRLNWLVHQLHASLCRSHACLLLVATQASEDKVRPRRDTTQTARHYVVERVVVRLQRLQTVLALSTVTSVDVAT